MLGLLVDKFITDEDNLKKLRELISVSRFLQMLIEDAEAIANERAEEKVTERVTKEVTENVTKEVTESVTNKRNLEFVQNSLKKGLSVDLIKELTGLDDLAIENLQLEVS
jgi:hypothetical protein